MNPFLRSPATPQRTPLRAQQPEPKSSDGSTVSLRLYDPIDSWGGDWGLSAKEFVATLDELPDDTSEIRLLINSPGGEVWEGLAILNALRAHPAKVTAVVEGIAASAASFIAAGADELHVMKNAELFVHRAWGLALGNAEDMQKMADDLAHEDRNIASIYAEKSGGTVDEWLTAMNDETWYSADEALAAGLADQVIDPKGDGVAAAKNRFDLSIFARSNNTRPQTPAATASGSTHKERSAPVPFTDEHLATLRTKLGLAADADEDKIVATVAEVMDKFVEDDGPPPGTSLVSDSVIEELRAQAAQGVKAREQQQKEHRERLVEAAVRDGRIRPADRDGWLNDLEKDPERKEATLASLTPGLVPLEELGTAANDASGDLDADALYDAVFGKEASRG